MEAQDQNNQIRTLFENALDAVVGMDERGFVIDWNLQAEKTFGWTRREAIGARMSEMIIPKVHRHGHENGLKNFFMTGHGPVLNTRLELPALRKDGTTIMVELSVTPVKSQTALHFYAFLRDISDRKRAAEDLKNAKDAADAANQAKSDFLANMSHEIRTPLGIVLGFSGLLTDTSVNALDKTVYVEAIKRNGELLSNLINDILDLSKIEAGKLEIEPRETSIDDVLRDIGSLLELKAKAKSIDFSIDDSNPIPQTILTDALRLKQILLNIVGNAIKFTNSGRVTLSVSMAGKHLAFQVVDTGTGMTAEEMKNLFQPFSQADASTRRKFGGTGLGLALSKHLAHLLGGDVYLEKSEPGIGSEFVVTIDAGTAVATAVARSQRVTPPNTPLTRIDGIRILLVDDSSDNQLLIHRLLVNAGATVETAENGQVAMEKAKLEPYDVILMDLQMPVLDGYAATSQLRLDGYKKPIIALTAHALTQERMHCLANGFDDHVTKPISRHILLQSIARHSGRESRIR